MLLSEISCSSSSSPFYATSLRVLWVRIQYLCMGFLSITRSNTQWKSKRLFHLHLPALWFVAQGLSLSISAAPYEEDEASIAKSEGLDVKLTGIGVQCFHGAISYRSWRFHDLWANQIHLRTYQVHQNNTHEPTLAPSQRQLLSNLSRTRVVSQRISIAITIRAYTASFRFTRIAFRSSTPSSAW